MLDCQCSYFHSIQKLVLCTGDKRPAELKFAIIDNGASFQLCVCVVTPLKHALGKLY